MRVLVAGASGVIGRPLVQGAREAGHERRGHDALERKAEELRALGAEPVVVDARDTDALQAAVVAARPEVVINQLTNLPQRLDYRRAERTFGPTTELRGRVGPALAGAAAEAGAQAADRAERLLLLRPDRQERRTTRTTRCSSSRPSCRPAKGVIALEALERSTLETPGLEGVVLRYGFFYGPGSAYASDGAWADDVRRAPLPDRRQGHRDLLLRPRGRRGFGDRRRARARLRASTTSATTSRRRCPSGCPPTRRPSGPSRRGGSPSGSASWSPASRRPRWRPRLEGASNEKAKRELGWEPRYPSWRQGFREALG